MGIFIKGISSRVEEGGGRVPRVEGGCGAGRSGVKGVGMDLGKIDREI
jgi:hypothetical protein